MIWDEGYLPPQARYGALSLEQRRALAPYVRGKVVMDLGAGDMRLSSLLIAMRAMAVVAVDKVWDDALDNVPFVRAIGIVQTQCRFSELAAGTVAVAVEMRTTIVFVSWPLNYHTPGIVEILQQADIVVYIGKNTDGTACGSESFWRHLSTRKVLAYVPDQKNVLTIYGAEVGERPRTGDELAFFNGGDTWMTYEDAEAAGKLVARAARAARASRVT